MRRAHTTAKPNTSTAHRRQSCARKVRHPDLMAALVKAIDQMEKTPGLKLDAYKCRYCHGYHLFKPRRGNSTDIYRPRQKGAE